MRILSAQLYRSGRALCICQTEAGERVQLWVESPHLTGQALNSLLPAVERALRAAAPEPGRSAIHGRRGVSGA